MFHKNNKKPETPEDNDCAALRLIKVRGEGLVKILTLVADTDHTSAELKERWDLFLRQLLDPTIMTLTTLFPRDGRMELFGSTESASCGVLFDLRLCSLIKEKFIFSEDALIDTEWFYQAKSILGNFTINDLLSINDDKGPLRTYNEILSGLNAKGVAAIVMQPATQEEETKENYFASRFYAISRKIYLSNALKRHLPILILDGHEGPYEYSFEEQQQDLKKILKNKESSTKYEDLFSQNQQLNEFQPVERESSLASSARHSFQILNIHRELLLEKLMALGERIRIMHQLHSLQQVFPQLNEYDEVKTKEIELLRTRKDFLVELFMQNDDDLALINQKLIHSNLVISEDDELYNYIRYQEDVAEEMQNPDYFAGVLDKDEEDMLLESVPDKAEGTFWARSKNEFIGLVSGLVVSTLALGIAVLVVGIAPVVAAMSLLGIVATVATTAVVGFFVGYLATLNKHQPIISDISKSELEEPEKVLPSPQVKIQEHQKSPLPSHMPALNKGLLFFMPEEEKPIIIEENTSSLNKPRPKK
jgi:hypothetical protein